jgi:protein O-mannosyl-transferase
MQTIKEHGWVFLLLLATAFLAFGKLMNTPLWDPIDATILCEAHSLVKDPLAMFQHIGFYFSQPLLQLAFLLEYYFFGLNPTGYIAVNLMIHAFNSFVVYMLVHMLFHRRPMSVLAAMLFALGVGSYGKIFMGVHHLESLLLAGLHMLVLYFFIRNDFRRDGSIRSSLFLIGLGLFLLTGLTRTASFSLLLTLIAYKAFFFKWRRGRAILSKDLLVFTLVGALFYWAQYHWGYRQPTIFDNEGPMENFSWMSIKNMFRYLTLMFFPLQQSPILAEANALVTGLFQARTFIRFALTLAIISYSFFGFVFGSKAIRFFIAWTYITLLPFSGHTAAGDWMNLSHLYLTSLGFCVILAAGTRGTCRLLRKAGIRRFIPYLVPLAFAMASVGLAHLLDQQHVRAAAQPKAVAMREQMVQACTRRPVRFQEQP